MFYYVLLFKAKQRFAYLLLIQSVYLFLNVLFLFRSVFHFFKCFCFVSLSKQFDIEVLLSKNLYSIIVDIPSGNRDQLWCHQALPVLSFTSQIVYEKYCIQKSMISEYDYRERDENLW